MRKSSLKVVVPTSYTSQGGPGGDNIYRQGMCYSVVSCGEDPARGANEVHPQRNL